MLGVVAELWLGRIQPRFGAGANIILALSLLAFGVVTAAPLAPLTPRPPVPIAVIGVSKIDLW